MASREIDAIDKYIHDSGVPHRLGSGYRRPSARKLNGLTSRHGWPGTGGGGLARDIPGPRPGRDSAELLAIFNAFLKTAGNLRELYYSGPGVTLNVQKGKLVPLSKVSASTRRNHHDHVHVAVTKGTFIRWAGAAQSSGLRPGVVSKVHLPEEPPMAAILINVPLDDGAGYIDLPGVAVERFMGAYVNGSDKQAPKVFFYPQEHEGHLRILLRTSDIGDGVIGVRYTVHD